MNHKFKQTRRNAGFTLVEMLLVISLSSIVLCTVGVIFYGLHAEVQMRGDVFHREPLR